MRATLLLCAAFVGVSLMLWNGCLGHRRDAGAVASPPASAVVAPR